MTAVAFGAVDDQTAPRPLAHAGHTEVLDDAHGLAQHGSAHAVALDQVRFGAEDLADRPASRRTMSARMIEATCSARFTLSRRTMGVEVVMEMASTLAGPQRQIRVVLG